LKEAEVVQKGDVNYHLPGHRVARPGVQLPSPNVTSIRKYTVTMYHYVSKALDFVAGPRALTQCGDLTSGQISSLLTALSTQNLQGRKMT
jgi:hypothetical protein